MRQREKHELKKFRKGKKHKMNKISRSKSKKMLERLQDLLLRMQNRRP